MSSIVILALPTHYTDKSASGQFLDGQIEQQITQEQRRRAFTPRVRRRHAPVNFWQVIHRADSPGSEDDDHV